MHWICGLLWVVWAFYWCFFFLSLSTIYTSVYLCLFQFWERLNFIWYLVFIVYCLSEPKSFSDWLFICFLGKWILTKDYIIHSAKSGRWLDETTYEWGYKIEKDSHYSPHMQSAPKRWREELKRTGAPGAFHRWKVVLLVRASKRSDSLVR